MKSAINGHQQSAAVISGHQRSSAVISEGHLRTRRGHRGLKLSQGRGYGRCARSLRTVTGRPVEWRRAERCVERLDERLDGRRHAKAVECRAPADRLELR
jgi:hypothetical protein